MKNYRLLILFLSICFVLIGCADNTDNQTKNTDDVDYEKISNVNTFVQTSSNKAKDILKKRKEVTKVYAVNTDKKLIVAFEIKHAKRLQLAAIRKKVQKQFKKQFPNQKVEVSTDKKIVIELNKLEERLQNKDINKKKLKKEINHLITLMNEQT